MAADDVYMVNTPLPNGLDRFWMTVPRKQYVEFRVQACEHAQLDLHAASADSASYQVLFGSGENSLLEIYDDRHEGARETLVYPGLLNCDFPLAFWVGWADGVIQVGGKTEWCPVEVSL